MDSVLVPIAASVLHVGFRAVWGRREALASFILFFSLSQEYFWHHRSKVFPRQEDRNYQLEAQISGDQKHLFPWS